ASDTFMLLGNAFEDRAGACQERGWLAEDMAGKVFAHVDSRFVLNSGSILMGTKAFWFGADSISAPEEVRGWVSNFGYGTNWSQRLISPAVTLSGTTISLTFDGRIETDAGPIRNSSASAKYLTVQAKAGDGTWRFLVSHVTPMSTGV